MKFLQVFTILLLFIACNSDQASETKTPESKSENTAEPIAIIEQWLTWDGNGKMPHLVLISGDEEYRSEEALPQLAKILSERHGFKCTVLFAQDPKFPGVVDPNYVYNIPGLDQLQMADMMVIFTRFRALPDEQMKHIDDFLKSGKPVLGMRTSTHAFNFKKEGPKSNYAHYCNYHQGDDEWKDGFGRLVMGEHWVSHHGHHGVQSTKGFIAAGAADHGITNGFEDGAVWGPTDVYEVRLPLPGDAQPIIIGQVTERAGELDENDPRLGMRPTDTKVPGMESKEVDGKKISFNKNDPMMPVAWTKSYQIPGGKAGKCFSTTMGASTDLLAEGTRRLLVNGVYWCLGMKIPPMANVDLVGIYNPSRFAFHDDQYWEDKQLEITTLK